MQFNSQPARQKGASALGILVIVLMAGAIGMFAIKVGPIYYGNHTISNILQDMQDDPTMRGATKEKLRTTFIKRLRVNGVYKFDHKNIKFRTDIRNNYLDVNYPVTEPLAGNLSVLVEFKNTATISLR